MKLHIKVVVLTLTWQLIVFPKYKFAIPYLFEGPPCLFASFPIIILIGAGWRGTAQATGIEASRSENLDLKMILDTKRRRSSERTSILMLQFLQTIARRPVWPEWSERKGEEEGKDCDP